MLIRALTMAAASALLATQAWADAQAASGGCAKHAATLSVQVIKRPTSAPKASRPARPVAQPLCVCPPAKPAAKMPPRAKTVPSQKRAQKRAVTPAATDDCDGGRAGGSGGGSDTGSSSGGGISYLPPPLRLLPAADPLPVHWPAVGDGIALPWPAMPRLPDVPGLTPTRPMADGPLVALAPGADADPGGEITPPIAIPLPIPVPVPGIPEAPTWAMASIGAALAYLAARRRH